MSMEITDNTRISGGYMPGKSAASTDIAIENKVIKGTGNGNDNNAENGDKGMTNTRQAAHSSVEDAVKRVNNSMSKTHCEFSYNDAVNRVSITVIDDDTGDIIREIPPEESLKMIEKMWEITGLMVDEKR